MAKYEHLPIFNAMMRLTVHVERCAAGFSRQHRYTLGSELRQYCHEALGTIAAANSVSQRLALLLQLRQTLERVKIHLILARELQVYKQKEAFGQAVRLVVDVSRQNEGWIRSAQRKETAQ